MTSSGIIHVLVIGTASDATRELVSALALSRIAVGWADDLAQIRHARRELRPAVTVFDLTTPLDLPLEAALEELKHEALVAFGPPDSDLFPLFEAHDNATRLDSPPASLRDLVTLVRRKAHQPP